MASEQPSAAALIEKLKTELERADVADPAARDRLDRLLASLDERIEEGDDSSPHELADELKEEAVEFETRHPELASTLRSFMNMLSSIGI